MSRNIFFIYILYKIVIENFYEMNLILLLVVEGNPNLTEEEREKVLVKQVFYLDLSPF